MRSISLLLRRIKRQKFISALSIGSLSIGMAVVLLIGLWVMEELSFDKFHKDGEQIYQVFAKARDFDQNAGTYRMLGDKVMDIAPEIKAVCRTATADLDYRVNNILRQGTITMQTDGNFFQFFSFPLVSGDAQTCLDAPDKMVISESVAKKWFPGQEPVGQLVSGKGMNWQVSGVIKDMPYCSSIQADIIIPFYGRYADSDSGSDMFRTYLHIPVMADQKGIEQRMTEIHLQWSDAFREIGFESKLMPLEDIHFSGMDASHAGNKSLVVILIATALGILLIACINFMNLFIASSFLRVKEITVRKTFGAERVDLVGAFFQETFVYVVIAGVIALGLATLCLPLFNRLANYQLELGFDRPFLYLYFIGVVVVTFLVAGAYPAFNMTRLGVMETFGKFRGRNVSLLQNALLSLQFTVSITFLIMIFFVNKQVNYVIDYDLGYDKENVVFAPIGDNIYKHYDAIREELLKNPNIKDVSLRYGVPTEWISGYPITKPGTSERINSEICGIKPNLIDMLGIKWVAGENPFNNPQQGNSIVLDETAVERFDLKEPIGAILEIWGTDYVVKGVVSSAKNKSLKWGGFSSPMIYMGIMGDAIDYEGITNFNLMCKVSGNPQSAIRAMEEQWKTYMGDIPCDYEFLDDLYKELYMSDLRLGKIFSCAMGVMMVLSLCGLFAMAYYKMQRRIKEVGIRKVNGATVFDLLVLLNTGFVRLVLVSSLIAGVIAYYFASYWLQEFEVRTSLSWWVFALAGIMTLVVTLLTVCSLTIKTIQMNPVETLRSE